jgi:hypothetical protein
LYYRRRGRAILFCKKFTSPVEKRQEFAFLYK